MRTITKLLSAVALAALLVPGSALATPILGMTGDTAALPSTGGVVNLTMTLATGPEGVGAIGYDIASSSGGPSVLSTAAANVAIPPLAQLGPPSLNGVDAGNFNLVALSGGYVGPAATMGTVTFSIGPNTAAVPKQVTFGYSGVINGFFVFDNVGDDITPDLANTATWTVTVAPIPEPGTLLLLGSGLSGLVLVGRRRD